MIPEYDNNGNLPPGCHQAAWEEIVQRYGYNEHRQKLLQGLKAALENLKSAGCKRAYLDGSFITRKAQPRDFDLCWEARGVNRYALDPLLILTVNLMSPRLAQKKKYGGDILPTFPNPPVFDLLSVFQVDDRTGDVKGILELDLDELP
jgi:hypothetical protein